MSENGVKILLIGYGNPGRLDDGLGPALAEAVDKLAIPGVTVDADYQLTPEDAAEIARHDVVIFADADVGGPEPFSFRRIEPAPAVGFSSHSVQPSAVLGLARELFGARSRGYLLGIRGYAFNEFGESLSDQAQLNLAAALRFLTRTLSDGTFREALNNDDESPVALGAPWTR
jgi:hydrogenase maturation protease